MFLKEHLYFIKRSVYKQLLLNYAAFQNYKLCWNKNIFSVWSFKSYNSAADRALFNLDTHCRPMISLLDEKNIQLIGYCLPICLLKV
jgi:hypothetical protein